MLAFYVKGEAHDMEAAVPSPGRRRERCVAWGAFLTGISDLCPVILAKIPRG